MLVFQPYVWWGIRISSSKGESENDLKKAREPKDSHVGYSRGKFSSNIKSNILKWQVRIDKQKKVRKLG